VWIGNTPAWIDRFFDANVIPPEVFKNYHLVSGVPYWGEPSKFMTDFLDVYEKYGRHQSPPDSYILLSYLQGRVSIEALRVAIASNDLSRAGFLRALQTLSDYNADGAVTYKINLKKVPYEAGVETRILMPDMKNASWKVIAPFAAPSSLK
jgi:hypothetical protein